MLFKKTWINMKMLLLEMILKDFRISEKNWLIKKNLTLILIIVNLVFKQKMNIIRIKEDKHKVLKQKT